MNAADIRAALSLTFATSEAIRTAGTIPAGTLYAVLCDRVTVDGFDSMIRTLQNAQLVSRKGDLLTWVGPNVGPAGVTR